MDVLNRTIAYTLTLFVFFLLACSPEPVPEEDDIRERNAEEAIKGLRPRDFEIIVIDECEYLFYTETFGGGTTGYGFMAHKGNCMNPVHVYNKAATDSVAANQ